jgi:hypothetical protein
MPALGVVDCEIEDLVAIAGSEEGFMMKFLGVFTGPLDELTVGRIRRLLKVEGTMGGSPPGPTGLEVFFRDGVEGGHQRLAASHGDQYVQMGMGRNGLQDFLGAMLVIGKDEGPGLL